MMQFTLMYRLLWTLLQSAFLPSSNHTSTATDEDESSGNVHSSSESPSTCDDSILKSITLEEPFIWCGLDAAVLEEDVNEKLHPSSDVTLMQALVILLPGFQQSLD